MASRVKAAIKEAKKNRTRSPNYPVLNLEKAIEKIHQLHGKCQTHPCGVGFAQDLWGYKKFSSVGDQCVAALKSFGLIEVTGAGDSRQLRVSEVGRRIVLEAIDKPELLKQAAMRPTIHAELWNKYGGSIPADELIRHYLLFDRPEGKFNTDAVVGVIARFRETIRFANLASDDKIIGGAEDEGEHDEGGESVLAPHSSKIQPPIPPTAGRERLDSSVLPLPLPLDDGSIKIVNIPRMSERVFKFFKQQLDAYQAVIVIPESTDESPD